MATLQEAFEAGVDAVIADPTINRGAFVDAMQTVITAGLSNAEGNAWVDAVATFYQGLGIIGNNNFNNLRNQIESSGKDASMALFVQLERGITGLDETEPVQTAGLLVDLREQRDNIDGARDRFQVLIDAEPAGAVGKIVKEFMRNARQELRTRKEQVREAIRAITGDPDS